MKLSEPVLLFCKDNSIDTATPPPPPPWKKASFRCMDIWIHLLQGLANYVTGYHLVIGWTFLDNFCEFLELLDIFTNIFHVINQTRKYGINALSALFISLIYANHFGCPVRPYIIDSLVFNYLQVPPLSPKSEMYSVLLLIFPGVSKLSLSRSSSTNCITNCFTSAVQTKFKCVLMVFLLDENFNLEQDSNKLEL